MPTRVDPIGPEIYRISTYVEELDLQFNQFLIRDEEPLLFHTGLKQHFPSTLKGVRSLIDPKEIRWIGFSHLEADECGALKLWQKETSQSTSFCSFVGKIVSIDDFVSDRPVRGMNDDEIISTGTYRFRFLRTPHVPHCWEAGLLFEETTKTLLCADLFHQNGLVEPLTRSSVVERFRAAMTTFQSGPFADYLPYTSHTEKTLQRLKELKPKRLAPMHGSTFEGDAEKAFDDLVKAMREILSP
jgi:flavorubredoxin